MSGIFIHALRGATGTFTETTIAAIFGTTRGIACLIVMTEVQK